MTITEWGSRPAPGIYAAAMLLPDAVWSSSHWNNPDFVSTFDAVPGDGRRDARAWISATKLSQIQQDDTPIMVPFYITQLRTQKKNVYDVQGPGSFYCDLQPRPSRRA